MNIDDNDEPGGFVERIKESPRTVSALIIILIIAAAIYAFSGDNSSQPAATPTPTPTPSSDAGTGQQPGEGEATDVSEDVEIPETVSEEVIQEQAEALPEPTRTGEGFMEVAQAGDGVTHLARRASTRWLAENSVGYEVTNEHRIYIEDYIKDQLGSMPLELGETHTIGFDLIEEAVASAGELTPTQLNNLSQYTYVLS